MTKETTKIVINDGDLIFEKNRHTSVGFNAKKIYMLGEKYSGLKPRGTLQNFEELKKYQVEEGTLFEDPQFSPTKIQLVTKWEKHKYGIKWLRPKEIVCTPIFINNGVDRFDVNQGECGDCWFLAALANITQDHELLDFIVPTGQSFDKDYAGIFHFRFWQYGRWIDVVVDDRLPTYEGKLIFSRAKQPNVFWTSLLEKAYAKLYKSYKNLEGGFTSEAMEDLTGGLNEIHRNMAQKYQRIDYYDLLYRAHDKHSFMGCGITKSNELEGQRPDGLYNRHAYSITDVQEINCNSNKVYKLLRLRNPWGCGEWTGKWSDNSDTWKTVPLEARNKLLIKKIDGEFWMEYHDFVNAFNLLEFCHINHWKSYVTDGSWTKGISNGGTLNSRRFSRNPQYLVTLNGPEKNKDYRLLVGLMQKKRRVNHLPELPIGFRIYRLSSVLKGSRLNQDFFTARNPVYEYPLDSLKQVTGRVFLTNGNYCIIPFTEDANESCEFLLRTYCEVDFTICELDERDFVIDERMMTRHAESGAADTAVKDFFKSLAGDDNLIGWRELKDLLDLQLKPEKKEFSREVCRSMLALSDHDTSGKLNFQEFYQLWEDIGKWRGIFRTYDSNTSNTLLSDEVREALREANISISNKVLKTLLLRYGDAHGDMQLEDFLHCCVKLNHLIDIYNAKYKDKDGIGLEQWLIDTIYT